MPLHPDARRFLDLVKDTPQPQDMTVDEFRAVADRLLGSAEREPVARVEDVTISGGDGEPMALRLYAPRETTGESLPVAVWLHGGSFVRVTIEHVDPMRRSFANATDCIVISVDQRLSPEAHFPAPLEDGYAALVWTAERVSDFGGDPQRIGVGGESSGGNLAAALAQLARKRGGPALAFQVLVQPLLDATCRMPSVEEFADGYFLTREQIMWCFDQYAPGAQRADPLLSPILEPDLHGLPPAVITTTEYDPLRDEGEFYARRLAEAGVPVWHERIEGMVHHFPGPEADKVVARLTRQLLTSLVRP